MSAMLLIPTASFAGVIVKTEQLNPVDPTWKFKTISGPSRSDIAQNAKVTVMGNQTDAQSTPPEALVNGRVPSAASDLTECVFLTNDNANAGSFVIDLGSVQPVAAVNSYSWHEFAGDQGARGPQVYTLFGSVDAQTFTKIAVGCMSHGCCVAGSSAVLPKERFPPPGAEEFTAQGSHRRGPFDAPTHP